MYYFSNRDMCTILRRVYEYDTTSKQNAAHVNAAQTSEVRLFVMCFANIICVVIYTYV